MKLRIAFRAVLLQAAQSREGGKVWYGKHGPLHGGYLLLLLFGSTRTQLKKKGICSHLAKLGLPAISSKSAGMCFCHASRPQYHAQRREPVKINMPSTVLVCQHDLKVLGGDPPILLRQRCERDDADMPAGLISIKSCKGCINGAVVATNLRMSWRGLRTYGMHSDEAIR